MRDPHLDELGSARVPAWVTRLRQAAVGVSKREAVEADVLNLAIGVAPEEPAWAQDVVRSMASKPEAGTLGQPPARGLDIESAVRYTVCQVGAQRLAIAVDHVLEVRQGRRYTVLPGMAAFVRGVTNVKGEATPVIGLAELLGVECVGNPGWERLLLVKPPGQRRMVGLVVDRVLDLTLLQGPRRAEVEKPGRLASFLTQECDFDGQPVRVLDVDGLLRSGAIEMLAQSRRENR